MKLFEPGKIGRLHVKNRIAMSAMSLGGLVHPDGRLSQRGIDYYVARAKGGAGLIITSACEVSRDLERFPIYPLGHELIIDNKMYVGWLDELADAVHDYGAKVAVQLNAGYGRVLPRESLIQSGMKSPIAPSPVPWLHDPSVMTRELATEEVEHLVQSFGVAAEVVGNAGIDAIELCCHAGYLFDQFLTSLWNKRTDKYGGDQEGRLRFVVEVVQRIKKVLGEDFPVIIKFGLMHYFEGGRKVEEGLEIARGLEASGVDALCVDAGSYETRYWSIPSEFQPPGCTVNLSEMAKKAVNIPVMVVGKIGYPQIAERVLQDGKADFIALARALLADPEWPNKVRDGKLEDIRPCIGCLEGCSHRILQGKSISCTVNPATGREVDFTIRPSENKKTVLVIGGGPGGMEAARVAALRGHRVALWEKGDTLGGNLIPASKPDFKNDYRTLINYLSTQIKKLGVDIKLGKEATPALIKKMNPEVVFVATGSPPIIPGIPGVEKGNVVTAIDVLLGKKEAGASVVVIGGGIIGCETALYLSQKGRKVTIVEICDSVARDMFWVNRMHLLKLLGDADVKILTETRVLQITDESIKVADVCDRESTLEVNTIVLALGLKPDNKLYDTLKGQVVEVYSIGDCKEPRKVINAIWEGFRLARLV